MLLYKPKQRISLNIQATSKLNFILWFLRIKLNFVRKLNFLINRL